MKSLKILIPLALLAACGPNETPDEDSSSSDALTFSALQKQQILDLANYPNTDLVAAGLSATTASRVTRTRNGADGVCPSSDDVYFNALSELTAVTGVTGTALNRLAAYAAAHPAPSQLTVENVVFHGWQAEAVVWGVNQATTAELDGLLDSRAATSLLTHRPFTSIAQLGPLSYVGATALTHLRGAAQGWWNKRYGAPLLAGTFDGVTFTQSDAETALLIVNQATLEQLTAHGIASTTASHLVAARPLGTLNVVAAVNGVGQATLEALLEWAQSGTWGGSCEEGFQAAVGPHLPDLLFMSESDRPFDLVFFTAAGATPPTAQSVLALVHATPGSTAELRDVANFYVALEPASETADPKAGQALQGAFTTMLTDVVYVAVHAPSSSPDRAQVQVYLLGRTRCGDLVGIHSISIET